MRIKTHPLLGCTGIGSRFFGAMARGTPIGSSIGMSKGGIASKQKSDSFNL